jgi:hypothetical protein
MLLFKLSGGICCKGKIESLGDKSLHREET